MEWCNPKQNFPHSALKRWWLSDIAILLHVFTTAKTTQRKYNFLYKYNIPLTKLYLVKQSSTLNCRIYTWAHSLSVYTQCLYTGGNKTTGRNTREVSSKSQTQCDDGDDDDDEYEDGDECWWCVVFYATLTRHRPAIWRTAHFVCQLCFCCCTVGEILWGAGRGGGTQDGVWR